jgi:hypothetical protein
MTKRGSAIAIAAGGAALLGAVLLLSLSPRRFEVGLSGLSPAEEAAYSGLLKGAAGTRGLRILKGPLAARGLPGAMIAPAGASLASLAGSLDTIPANAIRKVPPAMGQAVLDAKGRAYALPLQLDQFQVAYSFATFAGLGVKVEKRLSLAQLEGALAAYRSSAAPALLFAGGDDETLLLVLSALCLSRGGEGAYRALVAEIASGAEQGRLMKKALGPGPDGKALTLESLIGAIKDWKAKGYLHAEWYNLGPDTVATYLRQGRAVAVLIPLSLRRIVPYESINKYGWDAYPAAPGVAASAYLAPMTAVAFGASSAGRRTESARRELLGYLTKDDTAMRLAKDDGEATTLAAAPSPDVQARLAMNWAAESRVVVNGIYRDAFASREAARAFASAVREAARR